ncbi:MAG: anthranilate synthase component I family protein [Pyrinomonadaceae bacterium]
MRKIEIAADGVVSSLLRLAEIKNVAILDSCGVGRADANLLIAGIDPVEVLEISNDNAIETLRIFDEKLGSRNLAAIFTISYDFGLKLQHIDRHPKSSISHAEPDIYLVLFDCLIIHNYANGQTFLSGNPAKFDQIEKELVDSLPQDSPSMLASSQKAHFHSNFAQSGYFDAINTIKKLIRSGDTYQTNLTQQLTVEVSNDLTAAEVFRRLRRDHPAPFAAYIDRGASKVVSASPERFVRVSGEQTGYETISASPIKGTRRRGNSVEEDELLRVDLLNSQKDRAENTMIVDLMRNDLGRICEYGSVRVDSLCKLEEHPSLFHLVSTVNGTLRDGTAHSDIIKAIFPCGSITGAPKVRTMQIIEEIENADRGLSMGAIGCRIPEDVFGLPPVFEMSVAIRTMVVRDGKAVFNVGGGIVIDSDPQSEYDESLLKAKALLTALNSCK